MIHPTSTLLPTSPSRTVVTSFTPRKPEDGVSGFEEGDWVLCLASSTSSTFPTSSSPSVSCALSNGRIQVYDQQSLLPVTSFDPSKPAGGDASSSSSTVVTDLIYGPQDTLLITSHDGNVVLIDLRQPTTPSFRTNLGGGASALAIALGFDGYLAAVASDRANVHFLDLRMGKMVGCYTDSHTDEVTQVAFHPEQRSLLVTAGEDGLICVFDTSQSTEELALGAVINVGSSCRRVGFCTDNTVYCLTGSETASLWNFHTTTCTQNYGGSNLREQLSALSNGVIPIEYLVDAQWDALHQELYLCAGNSLGNAVVFKNNLRDQSTINSIGIMPHIGSSSSTSGWQVRDLLIGGHRGVVRAWCPLTPSTSSLTSQRIVTAGEDARLCEWTCLNRPPTVDVAGGTGAMFGEQHNIMQSTSVTTTTSGDRDVPSGSCEINTALRGFGGGPIRRQRRRPSKQTTAPY